MSREFRDNYGVYVCPHIFENGQPVLECVRDPDGFWQLFCGRAHDMDKEGPHFVAIGHLTTQDHTLHELTELAPGQFAERSSVGDEWKVGYLD